MPHPDRILKTYVLNDTKRRGALWSLWLTPEEQGIIIYILVIMDI